MQWVEWKGRVFKKTRPADAPASRRRPAPGPHLLREGGLLAPWFMDYRLNEEIERARRHGRPLAVAIVRPILLSGEAATPEAVAAVVDTANAAARTTDLVGWAGGGRLLIIMPETDAQHAQVAVSRLRDEMWMRSRRVGGQRWEIVLLEDTTPYETADQVNEELGVRPATAEAA